MNTNKRFFLLISLFAAYLVFPGILFSGDLEPPGAPGSTMKTLDEIPPSWHQKLPVSERFVSVMDNEAVLDKETGLVWARNANLDGKKDWQDAINYCYQISIADRKGWRLPTIDELASIIDMSQNGEPKVPPGVFINVQSAVYWSSTIYEGDSTHAWAVYMSGGSVVHMYERNLEKWTFYVWPVRGGK
ncbi:MAG: DUF1566 domain-containing protein [Pseudomonadota bacterium]